MSRYKLKKGKFGCYFFDSIIRIDLNLEMVLNKLNRYETLQSKLDMYKERNREQLFKITSLNLQIGVLKK